MKKPTYRKLKSLYEKIDTDFSKYELACDELEATIEAIVEFDFSIAHQGGDGHVLLNYRSNDVCRLAHAINQIIEHGTYTEQQHKEGSI